MCKESDTKVPSTKVTFLKLWPEAAGCTIIKILLYYNYNARQLLTNSVLRRRLRVPAFIANLSDDAKCFRLYYRGQY